MNKFWVALTGCIAIPFSSMLLVSCSENYESTESDEYIASSLKDLAQNTIDNSAENGLSEQEIKVLKKVSSTGYVEQADYEDSVNDYLNCMHSRGFELIITRHISGVIEDQPTENDNINFSADQQMQSIYECSQNTDMIQMFYHIQQGNPKLYSDPNRAILECLEDNGLVSPGEYTPDSLNEKISDEKGYESLPFNINDPVPQSCFYSAGFSIKVIENS